MHSGCQVCITPIESMAYKNTREYRDTVRNPSVKKPDTVNRLYKFYCGTYVYLGMLRYA